MRYLIVDTGSWLSSRKVLISPIAIGQASWAEKILSVSLTREQVKNSPAIDTDKPVSRQHEMEYLGYYSYPYYWGGAGFWGAGVCVFRARKASDSRQGGPWFHAMSVHCS